MLSIASKKTDIDSTRQVIAVAYEEARFWIGRRLMQRKPLLEYALGMPCVVMRIVDFGDGPLLWNVN